MEVTNCELGSHSMRQMRRAFAKTDASAAKLRSATNWAADWLHYTPIPAIPPIGVGTGRPLEGGPTAIAFLRQQIWSASWPIVLHLPRGGRAVTTAGSISVVGLRRRRQAMTRHANDDRLFSHGGRDRPEGGSRRARLAAGGICLEKSGLPRPDPLFGQPAVRAFLDRRAGMAQALAPLTRDGEEKWDDDRGRKSRAGCGASTRCPWLGRFC
jgi:hypothetical protein